MRKRILELLRNNGGEPVSGEEISRQLEVSRTAIWKHIQTLKNEGYTLYVATSKPEEMSVTILERFGLAPYFDRICGASTDTSRSTKDAVIAYLPAQSGAKEDMVMVGDTKYDVLGAKAHGIPAIGVSWGYGSVAEMVQAGAIGIADTMEDLLELIKKA